MELQGAARPGLGVRRREFFLTGRRKIVTVETMFRAVLLLLVLASTIIAEDSAFVKPTAYWRVLPVSTNNPSQPQPGWTGLDYDDSSWTNLQASFVTTFIYVPGSAEQTILPQDAVTYCFRSAFQVEDPSFVKWLTLRIDYESGFVAYLNGREIARRGFPTNTAEISLGAPATPHPRGPTELIDVSSGIAALASGTNVLAIQLHSAGDDLPSMLMVAELVANFTRGPFVENTTTNSTQIIWQTQYPSAGYVLFGKDADHLLTAVEETSGTNHVVTLTNLAPNQSYVYQVIAQTDGIVASNDWSHFQTFKLAGTPIRFLVFGDSGQAITGQYKIATQLQSEAADLVIHVGDVVYPCFKAEHVDARCFSLYRDWMQTTPSFYCMGNHDSYCGRADFLSAFYQPTNSVYGTETFYSFDHGDAHFVVLDTDTQQGVRYDPESPEFHWLESDLAATKQAWKFIFFHHVIRSSSLHSADDYLFDGVYDKYQLQAYIGGLATRYGAQVIFNGHDHDYERIASFQGYNSFVSGGGGATLYGQSIQEDGSVQFYTRNNYLRVTLDDPELAVEAIDGDGVVFDRFYRSRAASATRPIVSTWESPVIETASGSDLAGNIPGQTFNFSGTNFIRTVAGQRANLGHIHVRNDQNFLYIGFESATIWRDQAIALFLENPNQPGVTDLAALGNGVLDDLSGEGADGLDLLTNLVFRDFRPSVACLLGDEKADTTSRNFKRDGMRWATGQGVFNLDQNFSTVRGARLQQFDRSPQTPVPPFYNENADFIEVAIPLLALGNPQAPGSSNLVKFAAIAFSDPQTGPMMPQIDTAFAGVRLDFDTNGVFTLEPVSIQLAGDPNPFHDAFGFAATLLDDGSLKFEWNSTAGATYTIQSSPALGLQFSDVAAPGLPVSAQGARTEFNLPIDGSSPRFYRLKAN